MSQSIRIGMFALLLVMSATALAQSKDAGTDPGLTPSKSEKAAVVKAPEKHANLSDEKALHITWLAFAAGGTIVLAAAFGVLAQSKVVVATIEGIARNPGGAGKSFIPMLLGLAFIESLVLYAFLIAMFILP